MRFRKLRIAWSVLWGIAAVLLALLWARSYARTDILSGHLIGPHSFQAISCDGKLAMILAPYSAGWHYEAWLPEQSLWRKEQFSQFRCFNSVPRTSNRHEWAIAYAFLIAIVAATSSGPWIVNTPRFSLRTLLIATTLVAVVLGLIVYLIPKPPSKPPLNVGDFPADF
jgi:hypothetical protein